MSSDSLDILSLVPDLDKVLSATELKLLKKTVATISCPATGEGMAIALRQCSENVEMAGSIKTFPPLTRLHDGLASIYEKLMGCENLPVQFQARPALAPLAAPYRMLFEPPSGAYRSEISRPLQAAQGLMLGYALSTSKAIANDFAKHWLSLCHAGAKDGARARPWRDLAESFPDTSQGAEIYLSKTTHPPIVEFLGSLRAIFESAKLDLRVDVASDEEKPTDASVTPRDEVRPPVAQAGTQPEPAKVDDDKPDDPPDEIALRSGFIRWQWVRAQHAHGMDACGLSVGWPFLHRNELRERTRKLKTQIDGADSKTRAFATLALLSLMLSLPPRLVLQLGLCPNGDLWLDVANRCACWSLRQLIHRAMPSAERQGVGFDASTIVRLPMLQVLTAALDVMATRSPQAANVLALVFPGVTDQAALLADYEGFLRDASRSGHPAFPARFAYSFGPLLLHLSNQDSVAAWSSLDFMLAPASQSDYLCLREEVLFSTLAKAWNFLELGPIESMSDCGWVGFSLRVRDDIILTGWGQMLARSIELTASISPRTDIDSFVLKFNELSQLGLLASEFLMASRGTRLKERSFSALFHAPFINLCDKASSLYLTFRPVARVRLLDVILQNQLENLRALAHRMEREDRQLARELSDLADGLAPESSIFLRVVRKGRALKSRPLRHADLAATAKRFFLAPANFGRHFWLSTLVEAGASRFLTRLLAGHTRHGMAPHGCAMAVSVRAAGEQLRTVMESVVDRLALQPLSSLRPGAGPRRAQPACLPTDLAPLGNALVDDFLLTQRSARRPPATLLEPPPVDRHSPVAHAVVEELRARLARGVDLPSPWTSVLCSLLVFDTQWSSSQWHAAWTALSTTAGYRLGQIRLVDLVFPGGHVPLLLQQPTALFLNAALALPPPPLAEAASALHTWLVSIHPRWRWPTEPMASLILLGGMVQRWARIELSPHVFTCSQQEFGAAAISLSSLARIAYDRPRRFEATAGASKAVRRRSDTTSVAALLAMLQSNVAITAKSAIRLGENQRRRTRIKAKLAETKRDHGPFPPLIDGVFRWLDFEVSVAPTAVRKVLEASSLSAYLSSLLFGLLLCDDDLEFGDLSAIEWLELLDMVESDPKKKSMKDTRSAFRRFARFWRRQGAAVPGVVFVDPGAESAAAAHVVHASSTHISEREAEQIARWLDNRFFEEPLTGAKARVKTNLSSARPFRTEEVSKLRQNDAADSHGLIFVRTSGFSHLKWTQTARRSIEVPPELHRQVREFVDRVAALEGHSEFLFLWDDAAQQNQDVDRIDRALSEALRVVSGERTARRHSLRGSAIARRIFPDVEALIRALAANQAVHPARPETSEDAWLRVAIAAAQAGHAGMLSTLLYYFSVWPVALYVELAATLARLAPGDQLATLVDGWSPEAMRQALSRRRKAASVAGNDWSVFDGRLLRIERFPSLESLLDSEEITIEPLSASNSERATSHDEKHLHYMVLRLAGIPLITAGDATHLPMTLHAASEASLATYLAAEGRPAAAAGNGVEAALATAFGRDLLAAVRTTRDAQGLLLILSAINSTGIVPRAAGVAGVLSVARTLLRLLPSSHTLTVLPSVACADPSLFVHLSRVDPDIVVKATSRRLADGYRFGLTTRRPSGRGPRPDGRATALFSLVCHAWLALLLFP